MQIIVQNLLLQRLRFSVTEQGLLCQLLSTTTRNAKIWVLFPMKTEKSWINENIMRSSFSTISYGNGPTLIWAIDAPQLDYQEYWWVRRRAIRFSRFTPVHYYPYREITSSSWTNRNLIACYIDRQQTCQDKNSPLCKYGF